MGERMIFVDEFQDAASKDGDWLIIGKFTESVELSMFQARPKFSQVSFFHID
jgi:hypothetical protein